MIKIFNLLIYYFLILLGLIATSWIIWSRFIRERTIRNIPDDLLTEYRFWILIYICYIYFYIVKILIKEKKPNIYMAEINKVINKYLWKPLTLLDHLIKYNKYNKIKYQNFMISMQEYWDELVDYKQSFIILSFQIIPRIFLVTVLFFDTFYFHKLEIFYKVVLIGIIPFTFRYIDYSFNDFYDHLVKQLEDKYDFVFIFEKGYSYNMSRKGETDAIWHYQRVSIEEYIEIMYQTKLENPSYEYVGSPYCKDHIYREYKQKFKKPIASWTDEENNETEKLFEELCPKIQSLKFTLFFFQESKKERKFVWSKIVIFSIYFICWSYILIISYYNYPIELPMFKYLIKNLMEYLANGEGNPFNDDLSSINKNLITIENVKGLMLKIRDIIIIIAIKIKDIIINKAIKIKNIIIK